MLLGSTLLGVSYAVVRSNLTADPRQLAETAAARLGLEPGPRAGGELAHSGRGEAPGLGTDGDGSANARKAVEHRRFVAQIQEVQEELDLSALVRELTDQTDVDGLRLELSLRPACVLGDRQLIRTMAANLIDNAIRHNSPDGWIEIRTESAGPEARLQISNSGAMINAAEAASLTEPFRQLRTARTGHGRGLGLSIAASVAQAHGGQLAIDPLERGGLRVSVAMPAQLAGQDHSAADLQASPATRPPTQLP